MDGVTVSSSERRRRGRQGGGVAAGAHERLAGEELGAWVDEGAIVVVEATAFAQVTLGPGDELPEQVHDLAVGRGGELDEARRVVGVIGLVAVAALGYCRPRSLVPSMPVPFGISVVPPA